jgi:hypothetical protein
MKHLIKKNGEYTPEMVAQVDDVVMTAKSWFKVYAERGFNSFEILGIIISAVVNAQREVWLEEEKK